VAEPSPVSSNPPLTQSAPRRQWSARALLNRIWYNRPVSDEQSFVQEFRSHSFGFVLVATWTLCLVRTIIIAYQQLFAPGTPESLVGVLLSSALLYWMPAVVFSVFKDWSRRNYHWVLDLLYVLYYAMVALRVISGSAKLDDANILLLVLIITSVIFLRIPFRHAVGLTTIATIVINVLAVEHFGLVASFRLLFSSAFTLAMALYTSWGIEERDRGLFAKRLEAASQAAEARAQTVRARESAAEAQTQRIRAERAAAEEQIQRIRAQEAAAEEQEQRIRAERAATEAFIASSEKQRLHDQLSTLYSQRELLIRGLHHDANQSLHIMGSALLTLRQKIAGDPVFESLQAGLAAVALGTAELDGLIAGMYDLVKLGKYEPCYAPVPVNKLLDNIVVKFAGVAAERGLRFTVKRRKEDVFLWTDATALERIIGNLVSNAIKYTIKGGVLAGTVRHGNTLRIDVWDTGVGIPRAQKNAIFGEFVRLEQAGVGDVKGLGLGLAIVKLFRDKLAGHYLEHSSTEGRGSRFSISMPIAEPPGTYSAEPRSTLAAVGLPVERIYVVVVEDNPVVQASIAGVLRGAGYAMENNVRFAASVAEAAEIFNRMPNRAPNIVVCDYRLREGENANHVISLVDTRFSWERVPIILFSAEIEPTIDLTRPHLHVVVKTGNPSALLQKMELAVVAARSDRRQPETTLTAARVV
jgi:signal transduction histidine kinase/CheY-like chemotaxis protein